MWGGVKELSNSLFDKKEALEVGEVAVSRCLKNYNVAEKTNRFCVVTLG